MHIHMHSVFRLTSTYTYVSTYTAVFWSLPCQVQRPRTNWWP